MAVLWPTLRWVRCRPSAAPSNPPAQHHHVTCQCRSRGSWMAAPAVKAPAVAAPAKRREKHSPELGSQHPHLKDAALSSSWKRQAKDYSVRVCSNSKGCPFIKLSPKYRPTIPVTHSAPLRRNKGGPFTPSPCCSILRKQEDKVVRGGQNDKSTAPS